MPDPRQSPRSWRQAAAGPARPSAPAPGGKRRRVFLLAGAMLALVGIVVAWIAFLTPYHRPYYLPVCVTEYKSPLLPLNAQAEQDRQVVGKFFEDKETETFTSQEKRSILDELDKLKEKEDAVVLYLSAHVLADSAGDLWLLPANADVDDRTTWLNLQDVLKALHDCRSKRKLLILDAMRPLADPRLGVLANDVAGHVKAALDKVPDPNRLVLCACEPGQTSLNSPELGQSVFGHYLAYGLRGWAVGYDPDGKPNRVSVKELARFVRARVDRWARQNRDARQTPVLLGEGADFELVVLPKEGAQPAPEATRETPYPPWLLDGWKVRDDWWNDPATVRVVPRTYRELEATLLHAEQRWWSGTDANEVQKDLQDSLKRFEDVRARALRTVPRPEKPRSLALTAALQARKPDPAAFEALRAALLKLEEPTPGAKPAAADKAKPDPAQAFLEKFKGDHFTLAWAAFEAAADLPVVRPEHVHFLTGLLARDREVRNLPPLPQYVETLFLKRLDDLAGQLPKEGLEWTAATATAVQRAIRLVRDGERVAAGDPGLAGAWDPRAFPWIRTALDQAAQKRHDAEARLFAPGFASPARADQLLQEAADDCQAVRADLETVHAAYRALDEALVRLPGLLPYLMNHPDLEPSDERDWKDAVQAATDLEGLLANPPASGAGDVGRLKTPAATLQSALRRLSRRFTTDVPALVADARRPGAGAVNSAQMEATLEVPWLSAKDRKALWEASRELARALSQKTHEQDQQDDERHQPTGDVQPPPDPGRASAAEQRRAARRTEFALDVLRLGGAAGLEPLQEKLEQARAHPEKADIWPALASDLRQLWGPGLRRQVEDSASPAARDRLSRIVDPFETFARFERPDANPAVQRYQDQAVAFWQWQGERYQYDRQDLQNLVADAGQRDLLQFYEDASFDYLQLVAAPAAPVRCQIARPAEPPAVDERRRAAPCTLRVTVSRPGGPAAADTDAPRVDAVSPDDQWLEVTSSAVRPDQGGYEVPLEVRLRPGAENSNAPRPKGFLVAVHVAGRTFHQKIDVGTPLAASKRPRLLLSADPNAKGLKESLEEISLRPNTRQQVYVSVWNPTGQDRKLIVQLRTEGGSEPVVTPPLDVKADEQKPVSFGKPAPAAAGKEPDMQPLTGPVTLRLVDAASPSTVYDERQVKVAIVSPREYLREPEIVPGENQVVVKVRPIRPLKGPDCPVELVLVQDRETGKPLEASGPRTARLVAGSDEGIELTAKNLRFDDPADEGRRCFLSLTVDGQERAFLYELAFPRQGTPPAARALLTPDLFIHAPRVVRAGDPCPVHLVVDNARSGIKLEVAQDRNNTGKFQPRPPLRDGDRQRQTLFTPTGPDGGLLFRTSVKDWVVNDLDTDIPDGTWAIQVAVLQNGKPLLSKQVKITSDASPPEDVRFQAVDGIPVPSHSAGQPPPSITLRKLGRRVPVVVRGADPQSGIKEVVCFFGDPKKEKRPEEGVFPAERKDDTTWVAMVPIPAERKEEAKLTVEFVNGIGWSKFEQVVLVAPRLAEAPMPAGGGAPAGPKTGNIKGTVSDSGNPQQVGLTVVLRETKATNKPARSATTGEGGVFEFKDVEPGVYELFVRKTSNRREARETIDVKAGQTEKPQLQLKVPNR